MERTIIIGCDNAAILPAVLAGVNSASDFHNNIISVNRISDLITIGNSVHPNLIIFCFRNNQHAVNDFNSFVKNTEIPLLCISDNFELSQLRWNTGNIVFTCSLDHIAEPNYLGSRVKPILMLSKNNLGIQYPHTFAQLPITRVIDQNTNLSRHVMELDQKIGVLSKVKERIKHLYPKVDDPTRIELTSIVNTIKISANNGKFWDDFKVYFEQTNPNFLKILAQKHRALTPKDLKYCCYLKMNMTNDDIKSLLGINQESVRTHKYRLKKKMSLTPEDDLSEYLRSV